MTFVIARSGQITSWTSSPEDHSDQNNMIQIVSCEDLDVLTIRLCCKLIDGKIVVCNNNHRKYIPELITTFSAFTGAKPCFLQKESTYSNFRITSKIKTPAGFYQSDDVFTLKLSLQLDEGRIVPAVEILDEPLI
jgi:hypothetical protein